MLFHDYYDTDFPKCYDIQILNINRAVVDVYLH